MPQRRINDAQTERLLASLQDLDYRQKLAHKLAQKENIKYASAMRRLQRYVTKGAEKRTFARAPVEIRRETVKLARRLPVPADYERPQTADRRPQKKDPGPRPAFFAEIPPADVARVFHPSEEREISNYDLRAILAYFDGGSDEAGEAMSKYGADSSRSARLFELASSGVDVLQTRGIGRLTDAVRDWFDEISSEDVQDIEDFIDLLMNLPDWQIQMILEDMANSESTFADWMDAWRDSGMDIDAEDSEYWRLWRAAYARAKK